MIAPSKTASAPVVEDNIFAGLTFPEAPTTAPIIINRDVRVPHFTPQIEINDFPSTRAPAVLQPLSSESIACVELDTQNTSLAKLYTSEVRTSLLSLQTI